MKQLYQDNQMMKILQKDEMGSSKPLKGDSKDAEKTVSRSSTEDFQKTC